jgi:hypothetical protein
MTPEERLLTVILEEITSVKESQRQNRLERVEFQKEVQAEFKALRMELHRQDKILDILQTKVSVIAVIAGIAAAGIFQLISGFFGR